MYSCGVIFVLFIIFLSGKFILGELWIELSNPKRKIVESSNKIQRDDITDGELYWYDNNHGDLF